MSLQRQSLAYGDEASTKQHLNFIRVSHNNMCGRTSAACPANALADMRKTGAGAKAARVIPTRSAGAVIRARPLNIVLIYAKCAEEGATIGPSNLHIALIPLNRLSSQYTALLLLFIPLL